MKYQSKTNSFSDVTDSKRHSQYIFNIIVACFETILTGLMIAVGCKVF